jgi:hypothetical protein
MLEEFLFRGAPAEELKEKGKRDNAEKKPIETPLDDELEKREKP